MGGIRPANNIARWTGRTFVPLGSGVNGEVDAIAVSGPDVYVAGKFTTAGGLASPGVAMWNGSHWVSLGGGLTSGSDPGTGYALAVIGGQVYVGGSFTSAGGQTALSLAHWDGTAWHDAGGVHMGPFSSLQPAVYALAADGADLYVGGYFTNAGSSQISAGSLAVLHTATGEWAALGGGTNGTVDSLTVDSAHSVLYAGGNFTSIGGTPAADVAGWSIASSGPWTALGGGIPSGSDSVDALAMRGGVLYAGGSFTTDDGAAAGSLVQWNGTAWAPVGTMPLAGSVFALAVDGSGMLAVAGNFSNIGYSYQPTYFMTDGIAHWSGSAWKTLGLGVSSPNCEVDTPICGEVSASAVDPAGHLFIAGQFTQGGETHADNVAEWDGSRWVRIGPAINGEVLALMFADGNLYVGGGFSHIGGLAANGIAMWHPTTGRWSALGSGITGGAVRAMVSDHGYLYVGGSFSDAGGGLSFDFARWKLGAAGNGGWYRPPNQGFDAKTAIKALAVYQGRVILGGHFRWAYDVNTACGTAHQTTASGLAVWAETARRWQFFWGCGGVNSKARGLPQVEALLVHGHDLFVGGNFDETGTGSTKSRLRPASGVAMVDLSTSSWSALGGGLRGTSTPSAYAFAISGKRLYVGGHFTGTAGGLRNLGSIAAWNTAGGGWTRLGSGLQCGYGTADCPNTANSTPTVETLAFASPWLWAGGNFTRAQGNAAANISRWG